MRVRFKMINRRKFVEIDGVLYKHRQIKGRDFYEDEGRLFLIPYDPEPQWIREDDGSLRKNPRFLSPRYGYVDCYRWRKQFGIKNYEDWKKKYYRKEEQ